jgi:hypothetical protein
MFVSHIRELQDLEFTADNIADFFTKVLSKVPFNKLSEMAGVK